MFCKQCGTKNNEGCRFCEGCGWEMIRPGKHSLRNNPQHGNIQQRNPQQRNVQHGKPPHKIPSQGLNQHRAYGASKLAEPKEKNHRKPLIILIAILLLANIIVVGWIFVGHQTTRAFNDAMEEGNRYLLEENLEQAEAHFLRAIEIRPREVEPYLHLAEIYMTWDEPEEAIAILEQGLEAVSEGDRPALEEALDEIHEIIGDGPSTDNLEIEVEEEDVPRFRVEWVLEPSIEADDINYVPVAWYWCDNNFINDTYRQYTSNFAAIRRGDTFGLIGSDGRILGEGLIYENVFHMYGWVPDIPGDYRTSRRTYVLSFIELPDLDPGPFLPHHVLVNGQFEIGHTPSGTGAWQRFYYYNGLRLATVNTMEDLPVGRVPSHPIPVQGTGRIITQSVDREEWNSAWYGVFYQGQMQTDFLYTQMGSYSEGLLAVEQNGRWGYINKFGEVIIPIEFDSSFIMISQGHTSLRGNFAYAASEGFVPLVRDGVWEMRTISNEQVIEPGVFEAIRPIIDGRSWVRYNGLWGVIEIIENEDTRAEETEEEEDLDPYEMYREIFERYQGTAGMLYGFYDIDGNSIPELILGTTGTAGNEVTQIFTWSNGQVIKLFDMQILFERSEVIFSHDNPWIHIFRTGYIMARASVGPRGHFRADVYRISEDGVTLDQVGEMEESRWMNHETQEMEFSHSHNSNLLTTEEWNAVLEGYTGRSDYGWNTDINIQWRSMP